MGQECFGAELSLTAFKWSRQGGLGSPADPAGTVRAAGSESCWEVGGEKRQHSFGFAESVVVLLI